MSKLTWTCAHGVSITLDIERPAIIIRCDACRRAYVGAIERARARA